MCHPLRRKLRRGMSLVELSLSVAILALVAASMGTMAMTLQSVTSFTRGQSNAVQHGRVVLDRLDRTLQAANVSESFPGFMVVTWPDGSGTFPDTLVIWKPTGTAVDPTGVPRANELVIIRPNPSNPASLIEITNPSEPATTTYASSDQANWRTLVTALTSRSNAVTVELSSLIRTAATSTLTNATIRGCVRFRYKAAPSDAEIASYRAGTATWTSLAWPQDSAGKTMGMRSLGCFSELQLVPDPTDNAAENALPFFGSTLLWKVVTR
jgi:prepilin-type N-terminal cleavage/methylation domain-containing protein